MTSPTEDLCPVLAVENHDIITDDNFSSLLLSTYERTHGTVVNITCYVPATYKLQGSPQVTCFLGTWIPSAPKCVRKDGLTEVDVDDNLDNVVKTDQVTDSSRVVLLVTASLCAAIFIVLLLLLLIWCWKSMSKSKERKSSVYDTLDDVATNSSSIPRNKYTINSRAPTHTPTFSSHNGTVWVRSSWPSNDRAWTYLSVDRLLRDIERSRQENPRHSWRDFASMTNDYTSRRL